MPLPFSRRQFLAASAAAAACRGGETEAPDGGTAPDAANAGPNKEDPTADLAAAARLLGVELTPDERAMMLDGLEESLARTLALRTFKAPNDLAPASTFRALLPGVDMPAQPRSRGSRVKVPLPSSDEDIAFATVPELAHWLRTKKITSTLLTQIYLDRLKKYGPGLECVITLTPERALAEAKKADEEIGRGKIRGPLHGIPYGAKDLFDSKGDPTTWGAAPWKTRKADRDAAVIEKLADAGAVLLGKTSLGALAYGDLWYGGVTRNPWNTAEGSSGSSAGSASATAAGLVGFSLGTETLGSIVSPSMRCGTTGLRPTFGRVSRAGAMALCWSMDKVGPICRSVEGAATVLDALAGFDPEDAGTVDAPYGFDARAGVKGLKVGYDPKWFEDSLDLDRKALDLLGQAGVKLEKRTLPDLPWEGLMSILHAEAAAAFEEMTLDGRDDDLMWQGQNAWPNSFRIARFISAVEHVQATRFRRAAMETLAETFEGLDCMISPSFGGPMLVITNYTGHPSLTVRAGFVEQPARPFYATGKGLPANPPSKQDLEANRKVPHGITLWGQPFREDPMIRLGLVLEAGYGVRDERPPLPT